MDAVDNHPIICWKVRNKSSTPNRNNYKNLTICIKVYVLSEISMKNLIYEFMKFKGLDYTFFMSSNIMASKSGNEEHQWLLITH
jgi:hypothetical protein